MKLRVHHHVLVLFLAVVVCHTAVAADGHDVPNPLASTASNHHLSQQLGASLHDVKRPVTHSNKHLLEQADLYQAAEPNSQHATTAVSTQQHCQQLDGQQQEQQEVYHPHHHQQHLEQPQQPQQVKLVELGLGSKHVKASRDDTPAFSTQTLSKGYQMLQQQQQQQQQGAHSDPEKKTEAQTLTLLLT
jgi:hypothetical protein